MSLEIFLIDYGENTKTEIQLFNRNVSANALKIWDEVGITHQLYECSGEHASGIILPLESALCQMVSREQELIALCTNSYQPNVFQHALDFLRGLLRACKQHPNALIKSLN